MCENYSRLRMKTLERRRHGMNDVHIEKTNTFEDKISYIMH